MEINASNTMRNECFVLIGENLDQSRSGLITVLANRRPAEGMSGADMYSLDVGGAGGWG